MSVVDIEMGHCCREHGIVEERNICALFVVVLGFEVADQREVGEGSAVFCWMNGIESIPADPRGTPGTCIGKNDGEGSPSTTVGHEMFDCFL